MIHRPGETEPGRGQRGAVWLPGCWGWTKLYAWLRSSSCCPGWVCGSSVGWQGCLLRKVCVGHGDTAQAQHEVLAGDNKPLWDPHNENHA